PRCGIRAWSGLPPLIDPLMAGETQPAPARGLAAELLSLVGSVGRYFQSIGSLVAAEGREAGGNYLRMAILLLAALLFAVFGYLLVLLFVAFLAAELLGVSWLWISGGFALIHFALAVAAAVAARRRFQQPVFPTTTAELKRDFEALRRGGARSPRARRFSTSFGAAGWPSPAISRRCEPRAMSRPGQSPLSVSGQRSGSVWR
ncbi:MAG: phage holin family protein, partial [Terrimicrobiaceae bacterium]|nr:phage holin family protein [Terrimicrobiaceae bacterium]